MFNSQPNLFGWNINDETSELTFRIFDHPTIWIFKNTQTQSVEQVNISWAENTLNLSGYSTQDSTLLNPGEQVQLRLYWQVLSNLTEGYYKYSRFVEIQDEGGKTLVRTSTDLAVCRRENYVASPQ